MRTWVVLLACSVALGTAWSWIAPERWEFGPADGLLVGSALYMAAWRRFLERREAAAAEIERLGSLGSAGFVAGLALRALIFLLLVCVQAFLCFQVAPEADVRRGFVVLSAWIVMLALMDTGMARRDDGPARAATAASRLPSR